MGRTLVSITQQLAQAEERLGRYRRALARADQKIFDDLFALARRRLAAASMAADPLPMQIILLGMLIGVASAVAGLSARVDALEHDRNLPPRVDP